MTLTAGRPGSRFRAVLQRPIGYPNYATSPRDFVRERVVYADAFEL